MHAYHLLAHPLTRPVALIAGALLLIAGRRLFWLFVGIVGFFAGYSLAFQLFHLREPGAQLLLAVVAGLVGIALALFAQKLAIAVAGFLVGAYFVAALLGVSPSAGVAALTPTQDLIVLVGGIVAAVLAVSLFDVALVVLSSLAGASLVSDALQMSVSSRWLVVAVLAVVGIAVQLGGLRRGRRRA
jgi:hypothetical protein